MPKIWHYIRWGFFRMDQVYERALSLLRRGLNNPSVAFRDGQWQAIEALVVHRRRVLLVQRTGWGKSIVYFIATSLLRQMNDGTGVALLISPLLSLMRNQIEMARRMGVNAEAIHSANREEWERVVSLLHADKVPLLMVSPERLANEEFGQHILPTIANRARLLIVDEAHCISDWGHDFRPDYRRISRLVRQLPRNVPMLATTATANNRVVADIQSQLGDDLLTLRGPLARRSLRLQNIDLPSLAERLAWLDSHLHELPGSGIIYTLTVADAERVARWLQIKKWEVYPYHADLDNQTRVELENKLLRNQVKALVATVALGMGFDKPDLGFVVHFQRPASVVHYYQQIGRAGRAIDNAVIVLLGGEEDDEIADYFIRTALPPQEHTQTVLEALRESPLGLSVPELERHVNLSRQQIDKVIRLLASESPSPIRRDGSRYVATPVVYNLDTERVERLKRLRVEEQQEMHRYMQTQQCLMQFLQQALNDPHAGPCGRCAICTGQPIISPAIDTAAVNEAIAFLRRSELVIEPRKQWPCKDDLAIAEGKAKIPEELRAEEGRALCLWGDAGWGALVKSGKYEHEHYSDGLVEGVVDMILRWSPSPYPAWVTCVPSLRHPRLVADFAQRLAKRLQLPFVPCVRKVQETPPQKQMQNSFHQVQNIQQAFSIQAHPLLTRPVFLVDDVVDSGWTLTVVAVLLRKAGSGQVFPVTLAKQVIRGSN